MKILFVTQGYFPAIGGTEALIQQIAERLVADYDDDITVFTTNCYSGEAFFRPKAAHMSTGWEKINGVNIFRFPVRSRISQLMRIPQKLAYELSLPGNQYLRALASGPIISGLEKAIEETSAQVIVAASFPLLHMFNALKAAHKSRRPAVLVGCLHPQDAWGFDRDMIYSAIRQADRYASLTDFEAEYVTARGAVPERVTSVGVGVYPATFSGITTFEAKRKLGLENQPVIGFIGQLGGHKGVDTLLRAMPRVWEVIPDACLLIAGARTAFASRIELLISWLPKEQQSKVRLLYNFPEEQKPFLFAAADVVAYPSGYESFGISYLEAWMAGKPVIGCWRGAVPSVVRAGWDGVLVNYQDVARLAEAMILLLCNPGWASQLGHAGQEKVLARYTWSEVVRRYRLVFQNALEEYNLAKPGGN